MIQLYAADDHFSFISNHVDADSHSHAMLQITIACEEPFKAFIEHQAVCCSGIIIDSNTLHSFKGVSQTQLFFLVDPTSDFGVYLKKAYLKDKQFFILSDKMVKNAIQELNKFPLPFLNQSDYFIFLNSFVQIFQFKHYDSINLNSTIKELIISINSSFPNVINIDALATQVHLSQSRISHLFKENTGIALYSYILMQKLKNAISLIFQGNSITNAALQSGFDSSSHFAFVCKKMLGMSARNLSKDSAFLKVSNFF